MHKTEKVILWASHSGKGTGGGELSLVSLIKSAVARGYRVYVIIPVANGLDKKIEEAGAHYIEVPFTWWTRGGIEKPSSIVSNLAAFFRIRKILKDIDPSVTITNTMVHPWTALASGSLGIPHIWNIREFGSLDHKFNFIFGEKTTYRLIEKLSSHIVVNSEVVKKHTQNFIKQIPFTVSYPCVIVPELKPKKQRDDKNIFELMIVGGVTQSKGQLNAVRAMDIAQSLTSKKLRLTLVGPYSKPYRNQIEKFIHNSSYLDKESVAFLGRKENPFDYLVHADAYIMSSKNEAFGRVTVEAMACGLPVIGSNMGGTPEIIKNGEAGIIYNSTGDDSDLVKMAEAIKTLATDDSLRKKMSTNGKNRFAQKFNANACVNPYFDAIESLRLAEAGRTPIYSLAIALLTNIAMVLFFSVKSSYLLLKKIFRLLLRLTKKLKNLVRKIYVYAKRRMCSVIRIAIKLIEP